MQGPEMRSLKTMIDIRGLQKLEALYLALRRKSCAELGEMEEKEERKA